MVMIDLSVPVDYFTKRAKDLRSRVRAGDAEACARVRGVYNDAVEKADHELSDLGLMRAQHVVAVEHGFADWKALADSSGIEARLAITMARHPELNDHGIGHFEGDRNKSDAEKEAIHAANRRDLRSSALAVATTVTWLREHVQPTRTINQRRTSYGIKHLAEPDIGYITNGVFIAAGIIAGYPYEIDPRSANVPFGMSEKSLMEIEECRATPERLLDIDAIMIGRGLAEGAYFNPPSPVTKISFCPVTEIQCIHRVQHWLALESRIPSGSSLRKEAAKIHAAAKARWRELRDGNAVAD